MRLVLPILSLIVTCILTFNAPSWIRLKQVVQISLKDLLKDSSIKNSASPLMKGMLALFTFSCFKNYLMLFP